MAELTLRQQKFVEALTTPNKPTYCKPSAAYRIISPTVKPQSQRVGAMRMSTDVNVQVALKGQLNLGALGNGLKLNLRESKKLVRTDDVTVKLPALREHRDTLMDYARLTGQLVERREVVTISDERKAALLILLRDTLTPPVPHQPSLSLPSASVSASSETPEVSATVPATEVGGA